MNKYERHMAISSIIREKDVQTQDELAEELTKRGFNITQATVSRDIKEMQLIKTLAASGVYKYSGKSGSDNSDIENRLVTVFANSVLSVNSSGNTVVIRTLSGMASAAASAIDSMDYIEVLGCLAGDDTIFIVADSKKDTDKVCARLRTMMK